MSRTLALLLLAPLVLVPSACRRASTEPAHATPTPHPAMKAAPPTPLAEKKEELGSNTNWDPSWDAIVERDLPPDMLGPEAAHAVRPYCPRFAQLPEADKRAFWAYTFQALAAAEAGLNPTTVVHHTAPAVNRIDKVTHARIHQEGLLQLTYEDADRYSCPFDWQHDRKLPAKSPVRTILQPDKNLACGIHIMQNQVITKHEPLVVRDSYWSTLQPRTAGYRVFAKQMANVPAACGLHARRASHRH